MLSVIFVDIPNRKPNRLKDFDYSQNGVYFITICTHNRRSIFAYNVGAIHESPSLRLSQYGKIADKWINQLPDRFDISIDKYVIMPNHIHLLISIDNSCYNRAIHESPLRTRSTIDKAIGYLKANIAKDIHKISPSKTIWQRSYHDHIIRNDHDYLDRWNYIENNPLKWNSDRFYTEN